MTTTSRAAAAATRSSGLAGPTSSSRTRTRASPPRNRPGPTTPRPRGTRDTRADSGRAARLIVVRTLRVRKRRGARSDARSPRVRAHSADGVCGLLWAAWLGGPASRSGPRRTPMPELRLATPADVPALRRLIEASVRGLSAGFYTEPQVESALRHVFGPDSQLIADGTYYVMTDGAGELVAAGGWGRRRTLHGGDQMKAADDPLLDPAVDGARVRAFFVHPAWARRGLARRLFERCTADAYAA